MNPIGMRINLVMAEKKMVGDYAAVADHFGVKVPSVYGWLDSGRISKGRLPDLETWSGKPMSWWLGATESQNYPNAELAARLKAADPATVKLVELALYESDPEAISKLSPSLVAMVRGLKAAIELQGNT